MSVFVVGLNHRSAPLPLLERVGVPEVRLEKALTALGDLEQVSEAVLISTCNRVEVYAYAPTFHGAYEDVREFLAEFSFTPLSEFSAQLYSLFGQEAVAQLFKVTSGLDSAVMGESEIQGQVKRAWETARKEGTAGPELNRLFQHALQTGKRVRSNTKVGTENISSVCEAAVRLLQREVGDLSGKRALVLGTGEVGQTGAEMLSELGLAEVCVASRTWQRASHLAQKVGGRAVHLDELREELGQMDLLLSATGAPSLILERADIMAARQAAQTASSVQAKDPEQAAASKLVILDLAVPRDIDPSASDIHNIALLDITDVQQFVAEAGSGSLEELHRAQAIINEEVESHLAANSASAMAPLIVDFRRSICDISQSEFDRFETQLASLSPEQRETVETLVHSIVNKVLHTPTARIKESAESEEDSEPLADALRDLFDL